MKITYIFRCRDLNAHSVENMFSAVIPYVEKTYNTVCEFLPEYKLKPISILRNIRYAKKIKSDLFHVTGDVTYISLFLPRNRTILTVLDSIPLVKLKGFKRFIIKKFWYELPIKRCKYITVISEKTKQELLDLFPFSHNKIHVIPCSVSEAFFRSDKPFNESNPTILQIGTKENKNLNRLIESLNDINCKLVIVGKLSLEQISLLEQNQIKYENYFNVEDSFLHKLYNECDILAFSSTYEGFGMPIIEAQKVGKVVVTSNLEPMRTISGGGACLVNPYDVLSIKNGINHVIGDSEYRKQLIEKGYVNCEKYESVQIAKEYIDIYTKV